MAKKLDFAKMVEHEYKVGPSRFIVETEDGSYFKINEECSVGQVVNFQNDQVIKLGEPKKLTWSPGYEDGEPIILPCGYQGFVKECNELKLNWDEETSADDIYLALIGNPIPKMLLAQLIRHMLKA